MNITKTLSFKLQTNTQNETFYSQLVRFELNDGTVISGYGFNIDGTYSNITMIERNNKVYRNSRYFYKYIRTFQELIYNAKINNIYIGYTHKELLKDEIKCY